MKKVIGYFIDKILKFSETVNEKEWGKRMQEKPEFYDFLKKVVSNYLQSVEKEDPNDMDTLFKNKNIDIRLTKEK